MKTFKNSSCFLPPLLLVNNFLFIYGVESIQIIHVNFQTSIGIIEKNRNVCRSHSHQIYFFLLNRLSKLHKNIIIFKFKTSIPILEEVENRGSLRLGIFLSDGLWCLYLSVLKTHVMVLQIKKIIKCRVLIEF